MRLSRVEPGTTFCVSWQLKIMHTFAFRSKFEVILTEWLVLEFLLGFFATAANDCIPPFLTLPVNF